jgi:hypothetical protein
MDEVMAFLMALPFIGYAVLRGRHLWHKLWHKGPPKDDGCCKHDVDHK